MALNWSIKDCKEPEFIKSDGQWTTTDALIWSTMVVGIHKITEDNAKEFYARLHLAEKLRGAMLFRDGQPSYITLEDIRHRIGLSTNASALTRAQFIKQKVGSYFAEIVGETR